MQNERRGAQRDDEENNIAERKSKAGQGFLGSNEALGNEIDKLKKIKMRIRSLEDNEGKWSKLEQNIKVNEEKIDQMSRTMNDMVRNQYDEGVNRSAMSQTMEYEKLLQENVTLKADTLIYREDITHLAEVNGKLEAELEIARAKVLELLNANDQLHSEKEYKTLEIDKLTQAIARLRLFDNPEIDFTLENRKNKDMRIRELEYENKRLSEELVKAQTEHRIASERHSEQKVQQETIIKEITFNKQRENEQIGLLENRLHSMEQQLEVISRENISLRLTDEKHRRELTALAKDRDSFIDKYQKKKEALSMLSMRFNDLTNQHNTLLAQRQTQQDIELQSKSASRAQLAQDSKKKIISDLYSKIQQYKTKIRTKRSMSPSSTYNTSSL